MPIKPLTKLYSIRLPSPPILIGISVTFLLLSTTFFISLYLLLSPIQNANGEYLVVEGWLPDYALSKSAQIYNEGNYHRILVTGCQLETGSFLSEYKTYAELGASSLIAIGVPESCIVALPITNITKDRTWQTALSVKAWLNSNDYRSGAINISTLGPHGRRTWHLYKKALGNSMKIGIFSLDVHNYSWNNWFLCSEGFRQVTSEFIALIYVLLFFP